MSTEIQATDNVLADIVLNNDFGKMNDDSRMQYVVRLCEHLGLNPITRPFEFQQFQAGKTVLYANKSCTDQLRTMHRVSITTRREQVGDMLVVTATATTKDGRTDEATGVVSIAGKSGDHLANAMMKAETKAKRRVTLSICGLGMLDESETDTIPREPIRVENTAPQQSGADRAKALLASKGLPIATGAQVPEKIGIEKGNKMMARLAELSIDIDDVRLAIREQVPDAGDLVNKSPDRWPLEWLAVVTTYVRDIEKTRESGVVDIPVG